MLQENAIGPLRLILVNFSFDIDRSDWRMHPEKGGGAMWDIGCYGVNCARYFTAAEPEKIYARAHFADTGVDMTMQIALDFPSQVLANIDCSFEAPFRCRAELVGEQGRMILEDAFLPTDEAAVLLQRSTERDAIIEVERDAPANQYACQVTAFAESVAAGRLIAPAENGLANMQVLETALRQARTAAGL